jgi:hypothetical protein
MSWPGICGIALISIIVATTAYADLIPPGGGPIRPHRFWIELYVGRIPHGMVLILVDDNGNLLENTRKTKAMRISEPGTIYGVRENQLTTPFSFKTNKAKLVKLRTVTENDIPHGAGRPYPALIECNTLSVGAGEFKMDCHDLPELTKRLYGN